MSPSRSAWVRARTISSSLRLISRSCPFCRWTSFVSRSFSRRSRAASAAWFTVASSSCWCQGFEMIRKTSPELTACSATRKSSAAVQRMRTAPGQRIRACFRNVTPSISGIM